MSFTSRIASAAARGYGMFRIAAAAAVDPFFNYVTALLHGDGTNGAQNNTFLDSSTNNFTITRNGNTTQGTFSPFSQTGWSNYFDGSGDYLSVASATALNLSTGDFTIECWVYPITGIADVDGVISKRSQSTFSGGDWRIAYRSASTAFGIACGTNNTDRLTPAIALNQWNHIAFVRSSGTLSCYANGLRGDNLTWTDNLDNVSNLLIGLNAAGFDFPGYISNVRIVKGTAVYSGTTYTVPTAPLTAITNTSLLTCQANRFLDASSNNFTVTPTGDVSVQAFSPFNPTSAWSASSNGGSGYFDGSGDYLTLSGNPTLTTNFTIEFWFYMPAAWSNYVWVAQGGGGANFSTTNGVAFQIYSTTTTFYVQWSNGAGSFAEINTATSGIATNAWHHVAVGNNGTTTRVWIDGASIGTNTAVPTWGYPTSRSTYVGYISYASSYAGLGYISNVRMVTSDVYGANNSTITVPTAPVTAISNTQFLMSATNAGIYDNAAVGNYETVGNAQVSTSVKKYGTGSMAFDGTGDYLDTPSNNAFTFGTGDFTIEFWLNTSSTGFNIMNPATATGTGYWGLLVQTSNLRWNSAYNVTNLWLVDATPILNGQWNHVAICRTAGVTKAFFNGTVVATNADTTNYSGVAAWRIGSGNVAALNGYIDDFRITKYARYQYNFTPPTAAFPNIGGTVTLTADPYYNYTTLLLPGNGTNGAQNNTFLDSSSNAFTITRNGNTTQGNFSPFSQTGWGNYFGGSSDYINFASSSALSFASDFTVEAWVYNNYSTGTFNPAVLYDSSSSAISSFEINNGTNYPSVAGITATNTVTRYTFSTGPSVPVLQWVHVAWVRSSGTVKVYVNGTASTSTLANSAATGQIVQVANGRTSGSPWNGYISNLRITSSAVYTSNFTPSSVPLTAISGTQLLTCQANRFVDASSNALSPTLIGSPSVQAFSPFAPTASYSASTVGGSGYFDGSGDYLSAPDNAAWYFTGDFTVECWAYWTSTSSAEANVLAQHRPADASNQAIEFWSNSTTLYLAYSSSSSTTTITANQWYHLAMSCTSGTASCYVNGTRIGTFTMPTRINSADPFTVGARTGSGGSGGTGYFTGYVTDVRVVNGTGLYSGTTISVPTAPLTAIANTQLLLSYTNGAITDATAKNNLETVGNAQISTTQSKFGGSSMLFDGTNSKAVMRSLPNMNMGSGDFTVECWVYWAGTTTLYQNFVGSNDTFTSNACFFRVWGSGVVGAGSVGIGNPTHDGTSSVYVASALTANTWTHVAATRYNGIIRVFINGVLRATGSSDTSTYDFGQGGTCVGASPWDGANGWYSGYIDDLRITKGIARYTSNFTPPTSAFLLQ